MRRIARLQLLPAALVVVACPEVSRPLEAQRPSCACDSTCLYALVTGSGFGSGSAWDDPRISPDTIYDASKAGVRELWFHDIESPDTTRFTRPFTSYFRGSYSASNADFIDFYRERKDIPLAFQLGPNDDLWAFHSFVVKPVDSCYLITHSYYRHARFTFKAFGFLDKSGLDTLRTQLLAFTEWPPDTSEHYYYGLGVRDNERGIELRSSLEEPDDTTSARYQAIHRLYDHLDRSIKWYHSYEL